MHEMGMVRVLLGAAEKSSAGQAVTFIRLRVGMLSGVAPDYLREYIDREALERWGYAPTVEIEEVADPTDPDALGVLLVAVGTSALETPAATPAMEA